MENQYVKQFPELMQGKTIMYVHGFGSSGQSGTVHLLRTVLPNARVIAPDLPIHPNEALSLLKKTCTNEKTSLIIGTSMGGMYTEMLYGFDRICINPAFGIADTMQSHGLTGKQQFFSPRQDGVQEFYVDKSLVKEYRQICEGNFQGINDEEQQRVFGLFGDQDPLVHTYNSFCEHYPQAISFHGKHRMDDHSIRHAVLPVIRWIDDRQEQRQRPIIYIGVETLWDSYRNPASSMMKAVCNLIENYQVYFVGEEEAVVASWLAEHINVPTWHHTVYTWRRDLLYGDYLISKRKECDTMATLLEYGSDTFKNWEDILEYFDRLGGQ
ncbi:MAG: esterase [Prevotella sp.]|nr:esterase [Prevotella sp.]